MASDIKVNNISNRMGFDIKKVKILHGYAGGKQPLVDKVGLAYEV